MITINLLPQEFRVKEKRTTTIPVIPISIGVGSIFLVLTCFFYGNYWVSKSQLASLSHEWTFLQPQSVRLTQLQTEVETKLKPENIFLNRFVTADKPLTTILGWVNEFLPDTTWLTEFKLERVGEGGRVYIKGLTLPSKEKSSIEYIETYLHQLKEKMPDANLSLTTSRQNIKDVEVTQFIATFEWNITPPGAVKP